MTNTEAPVLEIGQTVEVPNGETGKVDHIFFKDGEWQVVVTFSDGTWLTVDPSDLR